MFARTNILYFLHSFLIYSLRPTIWLVQNISLKFNATVLGKDEIRWCNFIPLGFFAAVGLSHWLVCLCVRLFVDKMFSARNSLCNYVQTTPCSVMVPLLFSLDFNDCRVSINYGLVQKQTYLIVNYFFCFWDTGFPKMYHLNILLLESTYCLLLQNFLMIQQAWEILYFSVGQHFILTPTNIDMCDNLPKLLFQSEWFSSVT